MYQEEIGYDQHHCQHVEANLRVQVADLRKGQQRQPREHRLGRIGVGYARLIFVRHLRDGIVGRRKRLRPRRGIRIEGQRVGACAANDGHIHGGDERRAQE